MEFTELAHDRLLHELDLPHKQHAQDTLRKAQQQLTPSTSSDSFFDEHTPLLPLLATSSPSAAVPPSRVIAIADALLGMEERKAQHDDGRLTTWQIVRVEWRLLARLSAPMMVAGLLDVLPDVVLNILAGHLSDRESTRYLAALSLASLFQVFVIDAVVNGLSSAMDTLCSQAYGAKRLTELWLFVQAGVLLYALSLPLMTATLLSGASILRALGQDDSIATTARDLLICYATAIPLCMVYATMKSALQAQNIATPFVAASLIAWLVSGVSAYLLAYHTTLGIVGIALANPISWAVKALVLAPVVIHNNVFVTAWPGWQLRRALTLTLQLARLGISSVLMVVSQMAGYGAIALLAGLLPNARVVVTANGMFASLLALAVMPLMAFSVAAAIRIGNALGAGQARRAALLSRVVLLSALGLAAVAAAVMGLVATPYAQAFTADAAATAAATQLIERLLFMVPLLGLMLGLQGVFRACGQQMRCAQFNVASLFVIGMPLGLLLALRDDAGVTGLWVGHAVGLALFGAAGGMWLQHLDWRAMAHKAKHNTTLRIS